MPVVKMPDGAQVSFPDDMPKEEIKAIIASKFPEVSQEAAPDPVNNPNDRYKGGIYGDGTGLLAGMGRFLGASADAAQSAATFGLNDEITAGIMTGGGFAGDYSAKQQQLDQQKRDLASENPVASTVGSIGGGLALGGKLSMRTPPAIGPMASVPQKGLTLIGRQVPLLSQVAPKATQTGLAAAEGAAYGAAYGAGDARQGERLKGAAQGAALGAVTGAGAQMIGNKLATRSAQKAAQIAAPTRQDLATKSQQLYTAMEQSGVTIKPPVIGRLKGNFDLTLKGTTPNLSPTAYNVRQLADQILDGTPTVVDLHNFSKSINRSLREVKPGGEDAKYLGDMKRILDAAIENITPADVTGGTKAFGMMKEADKLWAMNKKAQILENIMDIADVNTGQYTQSGLANTITKEFRGLYKQISKGKVKGFSKEEIQLIRQIAAGGSSSKVVNLFAKFAPRGVISTVLGQGAGYAVGGPIGAAALTGGGFIAGRAADRGAMQAAQALRTSALTGQAPVVGRIAQGTAPAISGSVSGTTGLTRRTQ
jgi:hypothetical protein